MNGLPANERCVEHQKASSFLTLYSRNLLMSPTFSPNPKGEPKNLEIFPYCAHFQLFPMKDSEPTRYSLTCSTIVSNILLTIDF
jgi:hypothetical protein